MLRRSLGRGQQQLCHSDTETEQSADGDESHISQLQQLQQELAEANERRDEAEAYCSQLQDDLRAIRADAELQQFHAVGRVREGKVGRKGAQMAGSAIQAGDENAAD